MKKVISLFLGTAFCLRAVAAPITWQPIPAPDFSGAIQMSQASQQSGQQAIDGFTSTLSNFAQIAEENRREKEMYDLTVERIQAEGGQVSRNGNKIYITDADGTQIFCYRYISHNNCQMSR